MCSLRFGMIFAGDAEKSRPGRGKLRARRVAEKRGRTESSDRKSPPFAQTAKDGAPSSTGDGRREPRENLEPRWGPACWTRTKRKGTQVSDRKSPPFIPKKHRDGAEVAQTAKDGAPSSTGGEWREKTKRRERNSRRKDRAVRGEEDAIQFVGDTCNRKSGGKPPFERTQGKPHSKVGRDETRLRVGVPRWGELRCGSERPHP